MENITQEANPSEGAIDSVESVADQLPAVGQGEPQNVPTEQDPDDANASVDDVEGQPQAELIDVEFTDETGAKVTKGITVDELKKGYMLQRDYTHKTEQLANNARQFDAARSQWTQQFYSEASGKMRDLEAVLHQAVNEEYANVNWENLAANTTAEEFNQHRARYERKMQQAQQATANRVQFDNQAALQRRQNFVQTTAQLVPGWSPDPTNQKNIELTNAALAIGLQPDDIRGMDEPRYALVLDRVAQLLAGKNAVQNNAQIAQKKVENAPPVLKPQSARAQNAGQTQRQKEAFSRAAKSGRWQDLADALPSV